MTSKAPIFLGLMLSLVWQSSCDELSEPKEEIIYEDVEVVDPELATAVVVNGETVKLGTAELSWPQQETTISEAATIEIITTEVPAELTWSLFVANHGEGLQNARPLLEKRPLVEKTFAWPPAELQPGHYTIFAVIHRPQFDHLIRAKGSILKEEEWQKNRLPFLTVTRPPVSRLYLQGNNVRIDYNSADLDGDSIKVALEYSCDNQQNWQPIVGELDSGVGRFDWTIPAEIGQEICTIRAAANDGIADGYGVLEGSFGISDRDITYATDIQTIMANRCVPCHTGDNPTRNFRSDSYDNINDIDGNLQFRGVRDRGSRILDYVNRPIDDARHMPPGVQLDPQELKTLQLWFWGGRL